MGGVEVGGGGRQAQGGIEKRTGGAELIKQSRMKPFVPRCIWGCYLDPWDRLEAPIGKGIRCDAYLGKSWHRVYIKVCTHHGVGGIR